MKIRAYRRQLGFLAIVLLMLIVVIAALAVTYAAMLSRNTLSSGSHFGSVRALFEADSGLEYEQRRWAQNLDWYRSATDPNPPVAAAQAFGAGSFAVNSSLPATLVRSEERRVGKECA